MTDGALIREGGEEPISFIAFEWVGSGTRFEFGDVPFDANFRGKQLLALGAGEGKGVWMEFSKVSVEVALLRKGGVTSLAFEKLELEVDSINVLLESLGSRKHARAFKAGDRGSIIVVFDNLLWMKFVNVVGKLQRCLEASGAVLTRRV